MRCDKAFMARKIKTKHEGLAHFSLYRRDIISGKRLLEKYQGEQNLNFKEIFM